MSVEVVAVVVEVSLSVVVATGAISSACVSVDWTLSLVVVMSAVSGSVLTSVASSLSLLQALSPITLANKAIHSLF